MKLVELISSKSQLSPTNSSQLEVVGPPLEIFRGCVCKDIYIKNIYIEEIILLEESPKSRESEIHGGGSN